MRTASFKFCVNAVLTHGLHAEVGIMTWRRCHSVWGCCALKTAWHARHSNKTLHPGVGLLLAWSSYNTSAAILRDVLKDTLFAIWCTHLNVIILVFGGV